MLGKEGGSKHGYRIKKHGFSFCINGLLIFKKQNNNPIPLLYQIVTRDAHLLSTYKILALSLRTAHLSDTDILVIKRKDSLLGRRKC